MPLHQLEYSVRWSRGPPPLCRRPGSRHAASLTQPVFSDPSELARGVRRSRCIVERSRAPRLGKGVGLQRPRSWVVRLINGVSRTTTTNMERRCIWRAPKRVATGSDWSATVIWHPSPSNRLCVWVRTIRPVSRGHPHLRDPTSTSTPSKAKEPESTTIPVPLARSGDSVSCVRRLRHGRRQRCTTGDLPERVRCSARRNNELRKLGVNRQLPRRPLDLSTTGGMSGGVRC